METFFNEHGIITLYKNDIYIIDQFKKNNYWDINTLIKLREYINPNKDILEIGAHCGTSTVIYAKFLSSNNKVYAFEPQKNMYNLLKHNIEQNNLQNKVDIFNKALFCFNGYCNMNNIDLDGGCGNVLKRYNDENELPCNFGGICLGKDGEKVCSITIDDNLNYDNIGFIHCDAQGAENFIFSKATEFIKKNRPVIFFENNAKYSNYLFENVCNSYPEYEKNSEFNIIDYCMNDLNYSKYISNFEGGIDDLLVP
jgi:FkbM family methyltransferase